MWPWTKRKPDSLASTLHKLQANLQGKDADRAFLKRLAESMDRSPEPYEWILMVLRGRLALLEKQPAIGGADNLLAVTIRQAEIRAEIRLLRSLSKMSLQAKAALEREAALGETEFEAAETANH